MQKIVLVLAAMAVVVTMCIATIMSPVAGSALARAEGNLLSVPTDEIVVGAMTQRSGS
jgi:hypothetical protein